MKYTIYFQEDSKIRSLKTNSLENRELPANIIKIKKNFFYFETKKSIKQRYLKNIIYELSLMLEANLLLDEAFLILINKEKNNTKREFLKILKDSFSNSKDILSSLDSFSINPLVKSFFQITQRSGNPKQNLKALCKLLAQTEEIKREFLKLLAYPIVLLISSFLCLVGIFKFVVPNFQSIFLQAKMPLSFSTKALFLVKEFYENYFILSIFLIFIFTIFIIILYKKEGLFKSKIDMFFVKYCFVFSELYKIKIFYNLFLLMEIMIENKYSFHDSLSKAKILINNQYLLDRITKIENLLKSGNSISFAFESVKLFDDLTISLLKTGEVSNSMQKVVLEIKNIYKKRFDDKVKLFSLLIEPIFFMFIMVIIIWVVLAIFVPLWSMSDMLRA